MNGVAEQFESFTAAVTRAYKCLQKIKNRETERMGLKGSHVMCLYYIGKTPGGLTGGGAVPPVPRGQGGHLPDAGRSDRTGLFGTECGGARTEIPDEAEP